MATHDASINMDASVARLRILKAQGNGVTVGVRLPRNEPRVRKEIDELIKDTDCFNLYLLGLQELQRAGWSDDFSYSQIAGIHGRPYMLWHNVSQDFVPGEVVKGSNLSQHETVAGYCTHSSDLFPTWHRAYLALFEQALFAKMVDVANAFQTTQDRIRYLDAAARFGLPYWDPTLPRRRLVNKYGYTIQKYGIPVVMSTPEIMVRDPAKSGQLTEISNPLYSFHFVQNFSNRNGTVLQQAGVRAVQEMFDGFTQIPRMTRSTIRGPNQLGDSDHHYVNNTLTNSVSPGTGPAVSLVAKMYRVLSNPSMTYEKMANSAFFEAGPKSNQNLENSIEGIHNDIHTKCGQGTNDRMGHMGLTQLAAFDPIFWLHHTNVDRLFAIWQGLNPDTWAWKRPTHYVTGREGSETPSSPLIPFLFDTAQRPADHRHDIWWTSNDVRNCEALGYTYPELIKTRSGATEKPQTEIRALRQWVTDSYMWSTIAGETPAHHAVADLSRAEALPKGLRIDETNDVVRLDLKDDNAASSPTKKKWYQRKPKTTTVAQSSQKPSSTDRYAHIRSLMQGSKLRQWNVTIKVEKFALGSSFQIFLFLGDFNRYEPRSWPHDTHLLGMDGVFVNSTIAQCANCQVQRDENLIDSDVISLSSSLITYCNTGEIHAGLRLRSLVPSDVLPFLKRNLHWTVMDSHGISHDPFQIRSLHIAIGSQLVTLPTGFGDLPVYENEQIHAAWNAAGGWSNFEY